MVEFYAECVNGTLMYRIVFEIMDFKSALAFQSFDKSGYRHSKNTLQKISTVLA